MWFVSSLFETVWQQWGASARTVLFFMRYVSDIYLDIGVFVCFTITSCSVFISLLDLPWVLLCLNCLILQLVHKLTDACVNELCTMPHFLHLHRCYLIGFRSAVQVCITIIIFIRVSLFLSCAKQVSLSWNAGVSAAGSGRGQPGRREEKN